MFNNFSPENRAINEIMWIKIVEPDRSQMTIWLIRFASWIFKATDTHSEYVILIEFPLQQRLYEHAIMLRFTSLLVLFNMSFSLVNDFLCFLRCLLIHFRSQSLSTVIYQQRILGNDPVQSWQIPTFRKNLLPPTKRQSSYPPAWEPRISLKPFIGLVQICVTGCMFKPLNDDNAGLYFAIHIKVRSNEASEIAQWERTGGSCIA